jgi:formylglycine-generating enzyme required for sulfatase activity
MSFQVSGFIPQPFPAVVLCAVLCAVSSATVHAGPLHQAVLSNDLLRVSEILTASDPVAVNAAIGPGVTAIHLAAARNHVEIAAILIRRGADIEARTDGGFTPLHWAAGRDAADVARLLLDSGADINARTASGITPLHWASLRNATNAVELLLRRHVDLAAPTTKGMTPLHWAVKSDAAAAAVMVAYTAVSEEMERELAAGVTPEAMLRDALGVTNDSDEAVSNVSTSSLVRIEDVRGKPLTIAMGRGEEMDFVWIEPLGPWIGRYEVTNGQFRRFRPDHDSLFRNAYTLNDSAQPAVMVSWVDAQAFARWLNERFADRLPAGWGFRLLHEDEWRRAARCGDDRIYPWGSDWPPRFGNYSDQSAREAFADWEGIEEYDDGFPVACPVAESGANAWDLHGVGGNVWEWCSDWLDTNRLYKVRCGGGWDFDVQANLRVDARGFDLPTLRDDTIGFRMAIAEARPTESTPPKVGSAAPEADDSEDTAAPPAEQLDP